MEQDIRWIQRFSNYRKALKKLNSAIEILKNNSYANETKDKETNLEVKTVIKEGLIQRFEYTFELAWNVMKDYAEYQGITKPIRGSRDAMTLAFELQLIHNFDIWKDMLTLQNTTSHTYNEDTTEEIIQQIINNFQTEFIDFEEIMEQLRT